MGSLNDQGGPPRRLNAISIKSKELSNQSNRTLAEIFAKNSQNNQNVIFWRIEPNVLGFVRIGIRFERIQGRFKLWLNSPQICIFMFFYVFSNIESIESIEPIDQSTDRSNRSKAALVYFHSSLWHEDSLTNLQESGPRELATKKN